MTEESEAVKRVAVVGIGNMGSALAERLLVTSHKVAVWNRIDSKCSPLVELGANQASSAAEAADLSDTILVCVTDIDAVESILASDGIVDALKRQNAGAAFRAGTRSVEGSG